LAQRGPVVGTRGFERIVEAGICACTHRCHARQFALLRKERHSVSMKILLAAAIVLSLTAPAIAQAVIPALPADMLGVWGYKTEDCEDENGDGRLIVEKRRIASFASVFKLDEIRKLSDGHVQATATRFDEGEQRQARASLELFLLKPDMLAVKSDREEGMAYWRCTTPGKTS
jgi:hypothetical protein